MDARLKSDPGAKINAEILDREPLLWPVVLGVPNEARMRTCHFV